MTMNEWNGPEIDLVNGRIRYCEDWLTFECIESVYEKIKPELELRREKGLLECQPWKSEM